jgi:prepilin-type N-terminal cleavage/methylation domain-containing protein
MNMRQKTQFDSQAGLTLIEIIVVLVITSALLIMSYTMLDDAAKTSLFVEVRNDLPVFAQKAINSVQADVFQASTIFDSTPTAQGGLGPAYLAALQLPVAFPLLANSRMPLSNATGDLVPDDPVLTNPQYVGNCLMIVRHLTPASVFQDASPHTLPALLAERYQFEFFYLTQRSNRRFSGPTNTAGGAIANPGYYIDFMRSRSRIFADYTQISALAAAVQPVVVTNLAALTDPDSKLATPVTMAWNPNTAYATAFYDMRVSPSPYLIATAGTPLDMSSTSATSINGTTSLLAGITGGRIEGAADYSIAFRPSATTQYLIPDIIPKYATWNSATPTFPSGLEFLVVGPVGSRKALTRVVLMASYSAGRLTSKEVTNITATK